MTTHQLKIWPSYFEAVRSGLKTFEVRRWDRDYKVGDTLLLEEYDPETSTDVLGNTTIKGYTGREVLAQVTYILTGPLAITNDCIMAIRVGPQEPQDKSIVQANCSHLASLFQYKDGSRLCMNCLKFFPNRVENSEAERTLAYYLSEGEWPK